MHRLVGFDEDAIVFLEQDKVVRQIAGQRAQYYRDILQRVRATSLLSNDLVATRDITESRVKESAVFEHERVPFISYPHEWTPSMLRDAAIFHLRLFSKLEQIGLTLKDWHPYNILFKGSQPIFVDFTSLILKEDLTQVAYLMTVSSRRRTNAFFTFEMYRRMCRPYFLLPLYLIRRKGADRARQRILEAALNRSGDQIGASEVFSESRIVLAAYLLFERMKRGLLSFEGGAKIFRFLLRKQFEWLDVKPPASGYSNYYESKSENSSWEDTTRWNCKQRLVNAAIAKFQPNTMLDLGCNTGWYSILAAKQGVNVLAIDADVSSVDILYATAKRLDLSILPLVMNLNNLAPDIYSEIQDERPGALSSDGSPLFIAAERRIKCDLVLALALTHHLTLGLGWSFERLADCLNKLSDFSLVVEFVSLQDPLIVANPEFFPSYFANKKSFSSYTLENFQIQLAKFFSDITVVGVEPHRSLLICKR